MNLPNQLPHRFSFNPRDRFLPENRVLFEQPVSGLARAGRMLQALVTQTVEFIDISKWQVDGQIDWTALKAGGVLGVSIKASEGTTIVDPLFQTHFNKALEAGLFVKPYHFFRSNLAGGPQAEHFMTTITPLLDQLGYVPPLGVDVETTDNTGNSTRLSRLQACMSQLVSMSTLDRPGMYTSPGFANSYLSPAPTWINNYWSWIAHWTSASAPTMPAGWDAAKRKLWQYGVWNDHSWCQPVPGGQPDIDRDRFFGTPEELVTWFGAPAPKTIDERVAALETEARAHGWNV